MMLHRVCAFNPRTESGQEFESRVQALFDDGWQPLGISPAILILQRTIVTEDDVVHDDDSGSDVGEVQDGTDGTEGSGDDPDSSSLGHSNEAQEDGGGSKYE